MDNGHNSLFGLQGLILVALYRNGVVVGLSALGEVYLNSIICADLGYYSASLPNY